MMISQSIHDELKRKLTSTFENMANREPVIHEALGDDSPDIRELSFTGETSAFIDDLIYYLEDKEAYPGRKRLFNKAIYKQRFSSERTFAWIDKFRALRLRDDIKDVNFLAGHHLAFAMINLRHLFSN